MVRKLWGFFSKVSSGKQNWFSLLLLLELAIVRGESEFVELVREEKEKRRRKEKKKRKAL